MQAPGLLDSEVHSPPPVTRLRMKKGPQSSLLPKLRERETMTDKGGVAHIIRRPWLVDVRQGHSPFCPVPLCVM